MKRLMPLCLLVLLALVSFSPEIRADILHLKNGNTLEGDVLEETATTVKFRMKAGVQTFNKADILRIEESESVFDQFATRRAAVKASDADGLYELGTWCKENDLRKEARACFKDAIEADPNHGGAQTELGYVKYEGKWIKRSVRDKILAGIAEKEAGIFAGLKLGDAYTDEEARFTVKAPKDFEQAAEKGESVTFTGPVLGKVAVVIRMAKYDESGDAKELASLLQAELKKSHEDLRRSEDPVDAKMGPAAARLLSFAYTEDDIEKEHRVLLAIYPDLVLRLSIVCREGYFEKLRPFFDQIAATAQLLLKAPDVVSKEGGFGFCVPDSTYKSSEGFNVLIGDQDLLKKTAGAATALAGRGQFFTCFSVLPGKKGDGVADATSLESLRDAVPKLFPTGPQGQAFVELKGESAKTTVAGEDALTGKFAFPSPLGDGRYAVFFHGDRYYIAVFLNFGNVMGEIYVEEDFQKFVASFRFM